MKNNRIIYKREETGKRLNELRQKNMISLEELSRETLIPILILQDVEDGLKDLSLVNVCKICNYFNIKVDYLLGGIKMTEEKTCNCGPECTCGCQEGLECTCTEETCNCGCGEECHCEEGNCECEGHEEEHTCECGCCCKGK